MKKIFYILLLCGIANMAYAVIATLDPVMRQLPDGTWAEVYICGDENYHYLTTLSGERIAGTEVYRQANNAAFRPVQRASEQVLLDSYVPSQGKVKVPVILVNFKDLSFTMENPKENFIDFYNGAGGTNVNATGSVHDYFIASSDSLLDLEFDVYGPYTLSKDMAYYGGNTSSSHMKNMDALISEAAKLAYADSVDFSQYDNNKDGYVDNLSIVVAGYNEAEGGSPNTIWPHYSTTYTSGSYSGKRIFGYLVISEYRGAGGKQQTGIGTYCHEFSHALGLPDLYDTNNSSRYTVGTWDIMCSGNYNNQGCTPPTYSAFERFAMGWMMPIQLQEPGDYQLEPLLESNTAYLIAASEHNLSFLASSPNEYFLLENRQAVGWDANKEALVGTGMLISHITFNRNAWNYNTFNNGKILGYAIVGAYDSNPSKSSPSDLFPGTTSVKTWLPTLNNGKELTEQQLQNIKEKSDLSIHFSYGPPSRDGIFFANDILNTLVSTYDKRIISYDTAHVTVLVRNLPEDTLVIYATNGYFEFSLDAGETWGNDTKQVYQMIPNDTLYTFDMLVRHVPRRQSCDLKLGYITIESTHSAKMQQLEVTGISPRPVYITAPELLLPDNISTTSLTTHWVAQEDAELYYVTLFRMLNENQAEIESFNAFDSSVEIAKAGWSSNFVRTTVSTAESQKAILFEKTGEYIQTKEYVLSPDSLRFWLSNNYVSANDGVAVGGFLLLEGKNSSGLWKQIDNIRIVNTTKNLVKSYSLRKEDEFMQFRLTYTHQGGNGGVALDGFEAHTDKAIEYICHGMDREIPATMNSAIFNDLQPNTTYYFAVQAYENRGCNENFSPLSHFQEIRTLSSEDVSKKLQVMRDENGSYIVLLPEIANGLSDLYVFTATGQLLLVVDIPYATTKVVLPTLPANGIYFLKQVGGRMNRKDASGKLVTF